MAVPPEISEIISRGLKEGVSLEIDWEEEIQGRSARNKWVKSIHWHPGDPNKLAESIIKHCNRPIELELDGHKYVIAPVDSGDSNE